MWLAHKVTFSKWDPHPQVEGAEFQADAVTADLRTYDNVLSFWHCGDSDATDGGVEDAALAMASIMDKANKVELVWLERGELEQAGYVVEQTKGETRIPNLVSKHYDVGYFDYVRLGDMARRVQTALANNQRRLFRRGQVLGLLAIAARQERFDPDTLKDKLRSEVEAELNRNSGSATA